LLGQAGGGSSMWGFSFRRAKLPVVVGIAGAQVGLGQGIDLGWYPPAQTQINNLTQVATGAGVYGFIYNTSDTPDERYGVYNWCNMPHVREREYPRVGEEYRLLYVEVVS